jgi:hypothetical protein
MLSCRRLGTDGRTDAASPLPYPSARFRPHLSKKNYSLYALGLYCRGHIHRSIGPSRCPSSPLHAPPRCSPAPRQPCRHGCLCCPLSCRAAEQVLAKGALPRHAAERVLAHGIGVLARLAEVLIRPLSRSSPRGAPASPMRRRRPPRQRRAPRFVQAAR